MSDTSDQSSPANEPGADVDVEAEQERLDDLGHRIDDAREKAEDDLEPGHAGRMFADDGTERMLREGEETEGEDRSP